MCTYFFSSICFWFYMRQNQQKIANISSLDWCSSVRKSCIAISLHNVKNDFQNIFEIGFDKVEKEPAKVFSFTFSLFGFLSYHPVIKWLSFTGLRFGVLLSTIWFKGGSWHTTHFDINDESDDLIWGVEGYCVKKKNSFRALRAKKLNVFVERRQEKGEKKHVRP